MRTGSLRVTLTLAVGAFLLTTEASLAQVTVPWAFQGERIYQPRSSTLSPYLNLLNEETPGLSNYHLYVRPQLEEQAEFRSRQQEIDRLERAYHGLNVRPIRGFRYQTIPAEPRLAVPGQRPSYRRPASQYMDLTPYYGQHYQAAMPHRVPLTLYD